jgi:hypothetical protein
MGYFWLNQRNADESNYSDEEGKIYHYRSNVPGSKQLSAGDWFVYYRPGEYVLFGAGQVAEIEVHEQTTEKVNPIAAELQPNVGAERTITSYHAHLTNYHPFDPPLHLRKIKGDISFLQGRTGYSGVPQNSIRKVDEGDFRTILSAAGVESILDS